MRGSGEMKARAVWMVLTAAVTALLAACDQHDSTRNTRQETQRFAAEAVCDNRLKASPSKGTDGVALQLIRLDDLPEQVLNRHGCWRLINFWATWCEPCREEMPVLADFADRFRGRGLEVITVNIEPPQAGEVVHQFLRDYDVNALNLRLDVPDTGRIAQWLDGRWLGGVPFTVLLDPAGGWQFSHHGLLDADELRRHLGSMLMADEETVTPRVR